MTDTTSVADALMLHADFVRRLARSLAGADGDDLAQDAFVLLLQSPPPRRGNVRGWLSVVAGNLWRNRRRTEVRRQRREVVGADAAAAEVPSAADIAEREEVRRRVVAAVLQLPDALRDVVVLRFYQGLDSRQIGARLGCADSTVRTQLQGALERLRRRLDGEHGERRAWAVPLGSWGKAHFCGMAAVMQVAWPLRAAVVAVLLLAIGWLVLPQWFGASPPPPLAPLPVAAAPQAREAAPAAMPANGRQAAPAAVAAASPHGPDELWGRVVRAADGTPVAAAEVQLQRGDADEFHCLDPDYKKRAVTMARTRSDVAGGFRFQVARAHRHRLLVTAIGCAPVLLQDCVGGAEIPVLVAPGAAIEGVVRRQETGELLAGAAISVTAADTGCELAASTTAPDGTFRCADLPAGMVAVDAGADGLVAPKSQRLELVAGSLHRVEFALGTGRTARGKVTDFATGLPIAGAEVTEDWAFQHPARTAADGSYVLHGVGNGPVLRARAGGYVTLLRSLASGDAEPVADFALIHGGTLRGRIVDSDGKPVPGVYAAVGSTYVLQATGEIEWLPLAVAADGRFEQCGVDMKLRQLYARGDRFGARTYMLPRITADGEVVDLGDVVLLPEALLEGRVTDADGKPLGGVAVDLSGYNSDAGGKYQRAAAEPRWPQDYLRQCGPLMQFTNVDASFRRSAARTATDGSYRFGGLAGGNYQVRVRPGTGRRTIESGPQVLQDGELRTGVDIVVTPGPTIRGRVTLRDGVVPETAAQLRVVAIGTRGSRPFAAAAVTADGTFAIELSEPGEFTLTVERLPAGLSASPLRGVQAPADGVAIVLLPSASISGRVVDADGRGVRAEITCWVDGIVFAAVDRSDADGSFRIEVPPDFTGKLTARDAETRRGRVSVENVSAGTSDLVLQLK